MYIFHLYFTLLLAPSYILIAAQDVVDNITESLENYARPSSMNDKTVSELMNEQTEAIKKIMSAHKPDAENPIVPDKEAISQNTNDYEESIIKEELGPLEDVKAKCEYYFKISNSRQKDADKRNDISKQTVSATIAPYLYASGYVNRPVSPPIYEATPFNIKPTVESSVIASNLGVIKEETEQKRYYQYVPYDSSAKLNNINVKYLPYFYGSNYGVQTLPLPESTQVESEFNSNQKVASADSVAKIGIVKEESSQNKFYEYVPSKNPDTANIQYLQPLGYANQQLPVPVYIENQVTAKPIVEPPTSDTNIKERTSTSQFHPYVPYTFYQNPVHNIPIIQQNDNVPKESVSNIKYQITQTSSGHEVDSNQQHLIQNQETQYPKIAPLTLQNALVSDGKTLYYWYKSLPGYQVYVNVPYSANIPNPEPLPPTNQGYNYQSNIKYTYITQPPKVPESTTATPTTTTTEIIPSFEVKYSTNEASSRDVLKHQLKFVYPVPYSDTVNYNPKQIDPYAYYPKELQPSTVNFRLPYVPTFHLIKTLDIPSKYAQSGKLQPEVSTKK